MSQPQNPTGSARKNQKLLLAANERLNTAYLLKESCGQLWHYSSAALGFVEGLNDKTRVLQRRASGLRDEEYLRLKILTSMLPQIG